MYIYIYVYIYIYMYVYIYIYMYNVHIYIYLQILVAYHGSSIVPDQSFLNLRMKKTGIPTEETDPWRPARSSQSLVIGPVTGM